MTSLSLRGRKLLNIVQTLVIGGLMVFLVYLTGKALVGGFGVFAVVLGVALIAFQIFREPRRLGGVVTLNEYNAPELSRMNARLAGRAGLQRIPELYLVPSVIPNAFTFGNRDRASIFVTQGLLNRLDAREVEGVLAHEMSHIRHNDLFMFRVAEVVRQTTTLISRFGWLLLLFSLPFLLFSSASFPLGLLAIMIGAPFVSLFLQLALFRTREFSADIGAVELTRDPYGLASALERIERPGNDLFSILFPLPRRDESGLLRTHPATSERIRRLRTLAR